MQHNVFYVDGYFTDAEPTGELSQLILEQLKQLEEQGLTGYQLEDAERAMRKVAAKATTLAKREAKKGQADEAPAPITKPAKITKPSKTSKPSTTSWDEARAQVASQAPATQLGLVNDRPTLF
jgi:hypothetical protein